MQINPGWQLLSRYSLSKTFMFLNIYSSNKIHQYSCSKWAITNDYKQLLYQLHVQNQCKIFSVTVIKSRNLCKVFRDHVIKIKMSLNIFLRKTEHTFEFQIIDLLIENNFQTTPPPLLFGPPRLLIFRSSVEPPLASFLLRLSLLFGIGE